MYRRTLFYIQLSFVSLLVYFTFHHHLLHFGILHPKTMLINIASMEDVLSVIEFHTVAFIDGMLLFIVHWFFLAPVSGSLPLLISFFAALSCILFQFTISKEQPLNILSRVTATDGSITNQKYFSEISRAIVPMP